MSDRLPSTHWMRYTSRSGRSNSVLSIKTFIADPELDLKLDCRSRIVKDFVLEYGPISTCSKRIESCQNPLPWLSMQASIFRILPEHSVKYRSVLDWLPTWSFPRLVRLKAYAFFTLSQSTTHGVVCLDGAP